MIFFFLDFTTNRSVLVSFLLSSFVFGLVRVLRGGSFFGPLQDAFFELPTHAGETMQATFDAWFRWLVKYNILTYLSVALMLSMLNGLNDLEVREFPECLANGIRFIFDRILRPLGFDYDAGWRFEWQNPRFAGGPNARSRRPPPTTTELLHLLPTEVFVTDHELRGWSANELKAELVRLFELEVIKFKLTGRTELTNAHSMVRAGLPIEKEELLFAISRARCGESGSSCAICLAEYESRAALRVLPCAHRFHRGCIDRWLTEQSAKCPLCNRELRQSDGSTQRAGRHS